MNVAEEKSVVDAMKVSKYFSAPYGDVYSDPNGLLDYKPRDIIIVDKKGKVVEKLEGLVFPSGWEQNPASTVATKYFRKADVPGIGRESDIRQLAGRVARKISGWAVEQGYFGQVGGEDFEQELAALTIGQYVAFNSPVWFNLGLDEYKINQNGRDTYYVKDGKVVRTNNFYERPQVSACFIVSPEDSIESMMEVGAVISSRVFKGGSGIGGDWSAVRSEGEPVSGGAKSSGAIRFMDVQDSVGRVIKSGGKTRRAATMQSIGIWHPDIIEILRYKYKEETKARVLIKSGSPSNWESHTIQDLRLQNVNTAARTDDEFWRAYERGDNYQLRRVVDGKVVREMSAKSLAKILAFTNHQCGDPGIQNHSIINRWHTCKDSGEIWASNPCSEYMFLNNTACNLASFNLLKFRLPDGSFDLDSFYKGVDRIITAQDAMVSMASYPEESIALNSHLFRTLGLGYANLGAYVMSLGLPYDSEEARDFAAAITSNMTAEAYLQSTRLAEVLGSFQEFQKNKDSMMEVMEMHSRVAREFPRRNGLEYLVDSANEKWKEVLNRGGRYGFRNAQVTLLAPTGTIGFMMGCDTTGCEPEFSLKKYKELAGGGSMIIVNKTVPMALDKLGYDKKQVEEVVDYIDKNGTVEGCEILKDEHIPIFDCSVSSGKGTRAIHPMGHLRMLGAIQPHLSGAISKTINCPNNTSVEEIENMFYQGWKLGVKAVAIYRDGCKVSQPLTTKRESRIEVLERGEREHLSRIRKGITQKVRVGNFSLFLRTGEYDDGRLGELFMDSLERGSEANRLLNENAIQFSEKLQYGVPLEKALEIFRKAGNSQISGFTDHEFIKSARGPEGFVYDWISAHYLGDISCVPKGEIELRPLPTELRVYQTVPELHMIPTVEGEKMYPGAPSLEETIERISGTNFWKDEGMDTRLTLEKIKRERKWNKNKQKTEGEGVLTGRMCDCGGLMISDGSCWKCPVCKTSTGGCGGG